MPSLTVAAPAKVNLTLDILGQRPDGYHELKMVMQSVTLADQVTLETGTGRGLQVRTNLSFLPNNEKNLAAVAALRFLEHCDLDCGGLSITVEKFIPVCAGTAGGSSDAAAVLRGLNQLLGTGLSPVELAKLGEQVGSDVPYCVLGGTALAEGRGEVLTPQPGLPPCWAVLCKPAFAISTPELFARVDGVKLHHRPDTDGMLAALGEHNLTEVARRMYNVFEDVLPSRQQEEIRRIKSILLQHGALGTSMTGSGPTVFALFGDQAGAKRAWGELKGLYRETYLTQTL